MSTTTYARQAQRIPTHHLVQELKRREMPAATTHETLTAPADNPEVEVNLGLLTAAWRGSTAQLTPTETRVLATLVRAHPSPVRAPDLSDLIWPGVEAPESLQNVRTYVCYLRRKLGGLIGSHPHVGYWLNLGAT